MPEGGRMGGDLDPLASASMSGPAGTTVRASMPASRDVATATDVRAAWQVHGFAFAVAMVAVLALYRDAVLDLVDGWSRSGTFAHGYVIFPVSAWLVWRIRHRLASLAPRVQPWALVPLVVSGAVWLVGDAAGVHAPAQYALVATVPCLAWGLFGTAVVRAILFPLAFLFFAVPVGDFLLPTLIDYTADFTVVALRLSGIPVFREGNFFSIPSGNWSVVEACSGLRYLIASVTLGCLFAYLNYRSPVRRAAFIVTSLIVPIVANWLRAYLIVMLAHLSSNALATGVDHLIYGWLFFGIVMMALFWVGNFWREDDEPASTDVTARRDVLPPLARAIRVAPQRAVAIIGMTVALVAAAAPWPALAALLERIADAPRPGAMRLAGIPGWTGGQPGFTSLEPHYERPRTTFDETFLSSQGKVRLFAAYYNGQSVNGALVTWHNDVVIVGDTRWAMVSRREASVDVGGDVLPVVETELRGDTGNGTEHLLAWRWYWINGRVTTSDVVAKLWTALDKVTGRGDDSAVVVLMTPVDGAGSESAEAVLAGFARRAQPSIAAALATVHDEARGARGPR